MFNEIAIRQTLNEVTASIHQELPHNMQLSINFKNHKVWVDVTDASENIPIELPINSNMLSAFDQILQGIEYASRFYYGK